MVVALRSGWITSLQNTNSGSSVFNSPRTGCFMGKINTCNPFWFCARTASVLKGQPSSGPAYVLARAAESFFAQKDWSKMTSGNITQQEKERQDYVFSIWTRTRSHSALKGLMGPKKPRETEVAVLIKGERYFYSLFLFTSVHLTCLEGAYSRVAVLKQQLTHWL